MADIPAGTGLGSSGSFTTALLRALHTLNKDFVPRAGAGRAGLPHRDRRPRRAGRQAGPVHRRVRRHHLLRVPPGRQRGRAPLQISTETLYNLEDNLLLFFTGFTRSASAILAEQDQQDARRRQRHDRQSALHQGARLREQGGAGAGRPARASPSSCTSTGSTRSTARNR